MSDQPPRFSEGLAAPDRDGRTEQHTSLAAGELVTDQLPSTPSRTVPIQFGSPIALGALSGVVFGAAVGTLLFRAGAGIVGALIGALGGRTGPHRGRGRNPRGTAYRDGGPISRRFAAIICGADQTEPPFAQG
jgi:hypothetical protein